jgi:cell shape-determining protein MreC
MDRNTNRQDILKKLAELESLNDQLQAELRDLDRLMKDIGFPEGISTLKKAASEIIEDHPYS